MKIKLKYYFLIIANLFLITAYAQDGSLDATFGVGGRVTTNLGTFNDRANAIAIQPDGKIVVAGNNGTIIRYQTNGSLDLTFGNLGVVIISGSVFNAIAIQIDTPSGSGAPNDKIIVGGVIGSDFGIVRLNANGTLDLSFDTDGIVTTSFGIPAYYEKINAITIQNDGKILAVGTAFNANYDFALARYNPDGSLDTSFDDDGMLTTTHPNGFSEYGNAVAIQNDNKIIVAGSITPGGNDDFQIIRYNPNGTLDTSFNYTGKVYTDFGISNDYAYSIKIQPDNKIVVAGLSGVFGINTFFAVARYQTNGALDTSFDLDGKLRTSFGSTDAWATSVYIQNDSKIIVSGLSNNDFALARYNPDGTLDSSFDLDGKVTTDFDNGIENGLCMAVQTDGKILIAGNTINSVASISKFAVARYNNSVLANETFSIDQFKIYPNPATTVLNIENQDTIDIVKIKIINLLGETILTETSNFQTISIDNLTAGMYILEVATKGKTTNYKFIKH